MLLSSCTESEDLFQGSVLLPSCCKRFDGSPAFRLSFVTRSTAFGCGGERRNYGYHSLHLSLLPRLTKLAVSSCGMCENHFLFLSSVKSSAPERRDERDPATVEHGVHAIRMSHVQACFPRTRIYTHRTPRNRERERELRFAYILKATLLAPSPLMSELQRT